MTESAALEKALQDLRLGKIPRQQIYDLIHEFGEAGYQKAEADVVRFLRHDDPKLRYIALSVLTLHWDAKHYQKDAERMLFEDPDEFVRSLAATGLGFIKRGTREAPVLKVLIKKIRDTEEESWIRESAYDALLDILRPPLSRKEEWLSEIQETLERDSVKEPDLTRAAQVSPEEYGRTAKMWEADWQLNVDWDLVRAVETDRIP